MGLSRTQESGNGGTAEAQDTSQKAITDLTPVIVAGWRSVEEAAATAIVQRTSPPIIIVVAIFPVIVEVVVAGVEVVAIGIVVAISVEEVVAYI